MREKLFKAEGLVLRTRILGEADRLITLLTREEGKFEAVARGARRVKSKLAAGVDLFTHGRYTFHRGKTWPIITGQDTIDRFNWFRENPDLYAAGLYFSELTDRLISGEEPCPEIYTLLLEAWTLLGENKDRFLLCRSFELQLAHAAGYSPHLDSCINCGEHHVVAFSPRQGGMLCSRCRAADAIDIDQGTLALLRRLVEAPLSQVGLLRLLSNQKKELAAVTAGFLTYHLDLGEIKSRLFLRDS
ncbi:MAG: DNA repair protein RecO [Bacillota bacterium]|nr:DNA repair protein RecO [Bacillota bacterium]